MGLILDSSVVIAAELRGDNVAQMLKGIVAATGDQQTVLSLELPPDGLPLALSFHQG